MCLLTRSLNSASCPLDLNALLGRKIKVPEMNTYCSGVSFTTLNADHSKETSAKLFLIVIWSSLSSHTLSALSLRSLSTRRRNIIGENTNKKKARRGNKPIKTTAAMVKLSEIKSSRTPATKASANTKNNIRIRAICNRKVRIPWTWSLAVGMYRKVIVFDIVVSTMQLLVLLLRSKQYLTSNWPCFYCALFYRHHRLLEPV